MVTITALFAKLDYPSAPVMMVSTLACAGFIFVGGWWFRRAEERSKAERAALKAAAAQPGDLPTNP